MLIFSNLPSVTRAGKVVVWAEPYETLLDAKRAQRDARAFIREMKSGRPIAVEYDGREWKRKAPPGFFVRPHRGGELDSGARGARFEVGENGGAVVGARTRKAALLKAWEIYLEDE